jgi:hypothetical protein
MTEMTVVDRWLFTAGPVPPDLSPPPRAGSIPPPRDPGLRRLWTYWRETGLGQSAFAAHCGVSRQTIFFHWFHRETAPNNSSARTIFARTGINIRRPRRKRRARR